MPRIKVLLVIVTVDIIAISVVAALALVRGVSPTEYLRGGSFVAYFSFFQLLAMSGLAWAVFESRRGGPRLKSWQKPYFIWPVIAAALLYLAFDELFLTHDAIAGLMNRVFGIEGAGLADRTGDIVVGCYALIGILVLLLYRKELRDYARALPVLAAGVALVFSTVALDIVTNREDILRTAIADPELATQVRSWLCASKGMLTILAEGIMLGFFYYCLDLARSGRSTGTT